MEQYIVFIDYRTGYTDKDHPLIVKASGFQLTKTLDYNAAKDQYFIYVQRTPDANNGADEGLLDARADGRAIPVQSSSAWRPSSRHGAVWGTRTRSGVYDTRRRRRCEASWPL